MTAAIKTVTIVKQGRMGDMRYRVFTLAISVYATNGAALSAAELGLADIVQVQDKAAIGGTVAPNIFVYDHVNAKMMSYSMPAAQALETTDNTDAGTATRMVAWGH